jgi:CMP-2-keto-3-deoxyoctulosonic acid synthetase
MCISPSVAPFALHTPLSLDAYIFVDLFIQKYPQHIYEYVFKYDYVHIYTSGETNLTEDSEEIEQIKFNLAEKKRYDLMEIERKETMRINQEEDKWLAEARERLKERYSPGSVDGEGEE